jgi:repressor LexA
MCDDNYEVNAGNLIHYGEMVNLPIVGQVSCGNGTLTYEDIEGFELTPKEWVSGGDFFYLRAKGDSMTGARINDGDLLLIRKQEMVEEGEIAAVCVNDEIFLKRVYIIGDAVILQSENLDYPPVICTKDSPAIIIGKLKRTVILY